MRSIFSKIFAGYFAIIAILSFAILFISFEKIKASYINTISTSLINLGTSLEPEVSEFLKANRASDLDTFIKDLGKKINTRITVIDSSGVVLADSLNDPKTMENHKQRPEVAEVLKGQFGESLRYSSTLHENMLYVALPVINNAKLSGILRVSVFLKDIDALLGTLEKSILRITLVIVFVSLIGTFIFSRTLSEPIAKLNNAAGKLAKGDFKARVRLRNKDEIGELAQTFNYMAEQVGSLVAQLGDQKEELDAILSSIQEGLFVIEKDGKISLYNAGAKRIFNESLSKGKFYWEVIRDRQFESIIKRVGTENKNVSGEIELGSMTYLCSVTPLSSKKDMVALLLDITQLKQVNKIKKDLVLNVSHELRTPLTAIKGFVETLEESVGGENKHYLDIVKRHTERLINIVNDLLLLSELEEKDAKLEIERVNMKELIENIAKMFEQRLKEKGLELKLVFDKTETIINVDRFKIEQVLINLVDNAIKYTEKGGITISLCKSASKAVVEIQDSGIGIPAKYLSRIFERFYVVDKSRSRKAGGTGLGLSIVKHIVLLHNGDIRVESTEGAGTKFIVELPF